ncbi:hypothetical protein DITRI_Ditri11bG0169300 [Diplodiscus trichospermus]
MENGGNMFMGNRGQTGNNSNLPWELNATSFDWGGNNNSNTFNFYATTTSITTGATRAETTLSFSSTLPEASTAHGLTLLPHHGNVTLAYHLNQQQSLYTGDGSHMHPDPHLVCLKLGKRNYFEDSTALTARHLVGEFSIAKKGKPYYNTIGRAGGGTAGMGPSSSTAMMGPPATVPRCQVEGCHVALVNAKDYHRRHKVCEMHSKAPKVVVLGLEQRFCQQCSRFHLVSEFDDSKRSCRRRLAGHNERRRKSFHDSTTRNSAQGRALSLLSPRADSWISPSDLSSRSSAALRELIVENRAAILARQHILDWHLQHHAMEDLGEAQPSSIAVDHQQQLSLPEPQGLDRFPESSAQVTLDLLQASRSAFGLLPVRGKTKEEVEESSEL